ncbi:hypothetical protein E2C01_039602 [Portunus trituberculatus]|uniref:Uncharacterized protein n=1 Tax=Portunus trituberculatus TaxID=210409 RepID=A0A5B7FK82_PORTR|nr:hypothetical protein [Portunus trituberculatus]
MVGCPGWDALGGGSQLCRGQTFASCGGLFIKTTGSHGDEVPRQRQPALAPIVVPVGSHEVADLARETSCSGLSKEVDSLPQVPPTAVSCSGSSSEGCLSAGFDFLLMDFPSNRCYVTFLSCDEARFVLEHVAFLPLAGSGFKTELLHSRNIADMDYIPYVFDNHLEFSVRGVRQIPPLRWFVAYYRNGRGNFIHASRYLAKEIGILREI